MTEILQKERNYFVYRHLRNDTGQPFYTGIGKKPDNYTTHEEEYCRAYADYKNSKGKGRNDHWNRIVAKHGHTVEILVDDLTRDEAKLKEIEFIKSYGRLDIGTGILVNMTDGGDGAKGFKHTPESKAKLSKAHTGKIQAPASAETRLKMSIARKGKKRSPEFNERNRRRLFKPVVCLNTGIVFDSLQEAAALMYPQFKHASKPLGETCRGIRPYYRGTAFAYV